jgi:hypothetical protein
VKEANNRFLPLWTKLSETQDKVDLSENKTKTLEIESKKLKSDMVQMRTDSERESLSTVSVNSFCLSIEEMTLSSVSAIFSCNVDRYDSADSNCGINSCIFKLTFSLCPLRRSVQNVVY